MYHLMVRGMMNLVHFSNCCCCFWKELKVMFNEAQWCNVFLESHLNFFPWTTSIDSGKVFIRRYWVSFAIILVTFFAKLQRCYRDLLKIFDSIVQTRAENVKNNDRCRYLKRSNDQRRESLLRQNHDKALQIILYSKGQKLVLVLHKILHLFSNPFLTED